MSISQGSSKEPVVVITARVPQSVAEQFLAIAQRNHRSRSAEALVALLGHIEKESA